MPELQIYGVSDDLVEVEGEFREEYTSHNDQVLLEVFNPDGSPTGMGISALFTSEGNWAIAPVMLDEEEAIPSGWSIKLEPHWIDIRDGGTRAYSMLLTLGNVPPGVTVAQLGVPDDE